MVKIVANKPIEPTFLEELGSAVDSGPADIHDRSSSGFTVTQGKKTVVDFHFIGKGIKYFSGYPYDGTITKVRIDLNGKKAYVFSEEKLSVAKALRIYLDNDPEKAIKVLTRGDDKVFLSKFDDEVDVGKGDDKVLGNGGNDILKGGRGADDLRGNGGDDTLKGGRGGDSLNGGRGDNVLNGGDGKDTYVFDSPPDTGFAKITKFQTGETIALDKADFAGIGGKGGLKGKYLAIGPTAADGNDRIVYDPDTGALSYDGDGAGAGVDPIQFAVLKNAPTLSNDDFLVV
ncbi:calcium-binding protein [Bauldia sp.]|uniref:calcium-binding protein n=1 Tax=Bauldia sp. TaxID=2575872 RepID=UPI003BAB2EE7